MSYIQLLWKSPHEISSGLKQIHVLQKSSHNPFVYIKAMCSLTNKCIDSAVRLPVLLEVAIVAESAVALGTSERFLARMNQEMALPGVV